MKIIVISAANLIEGGPLTVLRQCLKTLSGERFLKVYKIIALVHKKELCYFPGIEYIEFPESKGWLRRIYYEYFYFRKLSRKLKPYLWLSLHNITPAVVAEKRVVYMHNPAPFYKWRLKDLRFDYKFFLFILFYKYLWRINIKCNQNLVVQQEWLRNEFSSMYGIAKDKFVVAYPPNEKLDVICKQSERIGTYTFFFASFPRPFKNFEVVCEAVKILNRRKLSGFRVVLTLNGSENGYAHWILKKYGEEAHIDFVGLLSYEKVHEYYAACDCFIFPSKLETWGLPISEFAAYGKPMLLADLPYAHETADKARVDFFLPENANLLADKMQKMIERDDSDCRWTERMEIEQPFVTDWQELFNFLLK